MLPPGCTPRSPNVRSCCCTARSDAAGFLAGSAEPLVVDEVQRAPELLLAIKAAVDRKRTPGRFLLTGSANVLLVPRVAESLAGRMEIVPLWPFLLGEIEGAVEGFIDAAFSDAPPELVQSSSSARMVRCLCDDDPSARRAWSGPH